MPGLGFWATVDAIRDMRLKNPRFASQWSTDRNAIAEELDYFTCLRLGHNPRYCQPENAQKKTSWQVWQAPPLPQESLHAPRAAAAAADRVENFAAGVGVVLDWLGDSLEPVPMALAEKRAAVCATYQRPGLDDEGKPFPPGCPENGRPDFIQRIEGWAASGVKELMNLARDLDLKTSQDDKLWHCQTCDCALRLKVWCKLDHILAHTSERVMAALPSHCWIRKHDQ